MTKSEIIKKLSTEKKYVGICRRLTNGRGDHKDLLQEIILHFLEQSDSLIEKIQKPDAYIYRTVLSLISKRGKFYIKYRTHICQEIKEDINIVEDDTKENELCKVEEAIEKIYWCDREILKIYSEKGTIRKTSKALNIPLSSTKVIIDRAKKSIKQIMNKPKILIMMQHNITALQYHRQIAPHERLLKTHGDQFEFTYNRPEDAKQEVSVLGMTDEQIKEYSLVIFLRQICFNPAAIQPTIDKLKGLGVKILLDIDDYWHLPKGHHWYDKYKALDTVSSTISSIKQVDWVTTTTEYFLDKIKPYNTNVSVLPNCINPDDKQFSTREIPNSRVRFGWIGGVFHGTDMLTAKASFGRFNTSGLLNEIQICLGGFNISGQSIETIKKNKSYFRKNRSNIIRDYRTTPKDKILATENINYMLPEYLQMEEIITDDYKICDIDYVEYLRQYTQIGEHISYDKPYRRLWGKEINNYGELYNEIDVALVPLRDNDFNRCKSELKIVEAGYMGKAVIVSDVTPYSEWIKDGVNGIKINPNRNNIDWYVAMRKLAKEPNMRKDMAAALSQTIAEHFNIDTHNLKRAEIYKKLTA